MRKVQHMESCEMVQKNWTDSQMTDAAYLDQAATWSKDLTRMRTRGPGDIDNAMRAIERDYGVDYWFIYQLRYKRDRLKFISVSVYERIKAAYQAECGRQMRKLQHDVKITEQVAGPDNAAVRSAKALLGED
jgi:hypothetical protein